MLKPRRSKQKRNSARSGQALVELLPSLVLFLLVMSAGLAYYRVMRVAVIRQEVVRNLAFAKIDYSGTLTTTDREVADGVSLFNDFTVMASDPSDFVGYTEPCFTVTPENVSEKVDSVTPVYGIGSIRGVDITTYAVVYRQPRGGCPF